MINHFNKKALQKLYSKLLLTYCPDYIGDTTSLTKWTIRDMLLASISDKSGVDITMLPGEQSLYKAFRFIEVSSATIEKIALLYYALRDKTEKPRILKMYSAIAKAQRMQYMPFWNRFLMEFHANEKTEIALHNVAMEQYATLNEMNLDRKDYKYWIRAAANCIELHKRIDLYKEALTEIPDSLPLLKNITVALADAGRYEEEEKYLLYTLNLYPEDADTHSNYGLHLHKLQQHLDKAEHHFKEAYRLCPEHINNNGHYAWYLDNVKKDFRNAKHHYEIAIKMNPDCLAFLNNYGIFLAFYLFETDKSLQILQHAFDILPNDPTILGNIALVNTTYNLDLNKAELYFEKAINGDPNNPIKHVNYIQLLFLLNKKQKALQQTELVKRLSGLDEELLLELHFYLYAHSTEHHNESSSILKQLIEEGYSSSYKNFTPNVKKAISDNHPNKNQLLKFAGSISRLPYNTSGEMEKRAAD